MWASLCSWYVCVLFVRSPQKGLNESQSELTLIQASASWFSQQRTLLLWQNFNLSYEQLMTWLWRLTSRWHDAWSPPKCSNEIAVQALNTSGCRSLEGHQNVSSCSGWHQSGQMHRRNITVVENKFVVMIINSDPVYVVISITKLLLLVIQISYLANLV